MENRKRKRKKIDTKKKLILALDGLLVVALIVAAVVLISTLSGRKKGGSAQAGEPKPAQSVAADTVAAENPGDTGADSAPVQTKAVEGNAADAMRVDFAMLAGEGIPAVAYLCSENTAIEYPVVQHIDNEYYMARNAVGKKDENGAIYLDCRNSAEFLDEQIVIFGNPMADGSMFGSLVSYRDESYLSEHPSLYLYTPNGNYRIDVFAAHTASPAMSNYPIWFTDAAARADYIEAAKAQSSIKPVVDIAPGAKLICLVTASDFDAGANSRFVVHGVMTQI